MMRTVLSILSLTFALAAAAAPAQEKTSVSNLLLQNYQIVNSSIGPQFIVLILKKDANLYTCVVAMQSGETQSCRAIK